MLRIGNNGSLHLSGHHVSLPLEKMKGFMLANISEPCVLEGAKMCDLMNVMLHLQDFIQDYFLEEYHAVNVLVNTMTPSQKIERVEFYKEMVIDASGFMTIVPKVNIVAGENGSDSLREADVVLLDRLKVNDFSGSMKDVKLFANFTLLEVMDCAFSELSHTLSSGLAESSPIWSL